MTRSLQEARIDHAAWLTTNSNGLRLGIAGVDMKLVESIYLDAHLAGRIRGEIATEEMIDRMALAAGETS